MSFIFEWIYNGFSSVLQFLGKATFLGIYHIFQSLCISSNSLNTSSLWYIQRKIMLIFFFSFQDSTRNLENLYSWVWTMQAKPLFCICSKMTDWASTFLHYIRVGLPVPGDLLISKCRCQGWRMNPQQMQCFSSLRSQKTAHLKKIPCRTHSGHILINLNLWNSVTLCSHQSVTGHISLIYF